MYCVVAASRGVSNSRSDSLVISSLVEQASKQVYVLGILSCSRVLATRSYSLRNRLYRVSPYQVLVTSCDSSCQCSVDSLVTLSSNHFTREKITSECNVTFERYRISICRKFPSFWDTATVTYGIIDNIVHPLMSQCTLSVSHTYTFSLGVSGNLARIS